MCDICNLLEVFIRLKRNSYIKANSFDSSNKEGHIALHISVGLNTFCN